MKGLFKIKNIGIDIGGMTIKSGIVDENGNIIQRLIIDTCVDKGFEVISQNIIKMIYTLIEKSNLNINDIGTIGVGIPGVADKNGKVHYATNLYWTNVELGKVLSDEFPKNNICIENDATIACVAEQSFGSIKGVENAIMLTLGTGVGGGIIINGKKYSGNIGIGSEIGHMIIGEKNFYNCNCGNDGCFETYCSASAVINYALKLIDENEHTVLFKNIKKDDLTAKMIFDGYKQGDNISIKVVNRFIEYLSKGIASLVNVFDPEYIVLGGGLSNAYDVYIDELYNKVKEKIIFKNLPFAKIIKADLGNDAGIIGAAML